MNGVRKASGCDVLIVVSTPQRRGAEIEAVALAEQLRGRGRRCDVVAVGSVPLSGTPAPPSLEIPVLGSGKRSLTTVRALRQRSRSAGVVVAYGGVTLPVCVAALLGLRVPLVYRSIGTATQWIRGSLHRRRTAWFLQRASRIVVLWQEAADEMASAFSLAPDRFAVIPNARDPQWFRVPSAGERAQSRRDLEIPDGRNVLAAIGALSAEKRVDRVIAAAAHIPDSVLLVAGDGPERDRLRELAFGAGVNCRFLGALDDVRPVLWAADVLLMPSATEGMPGALIEAAMTGVPAVASNVGAIPHMATDGVGLVPLALDATPTEMAAAVSECLRNGVVGANDRFSWSQVAPMWWRLLDEVEQ